MALYADEDAVANSNRSFHEVSVSSGWRGDAGLPWADEVVELIDELAIERLPEHLTEGRRASLDDCRKAREERDAERERRTAGARRRPGASRDAARGPFWAQPLRGLAGGRGRPRRVRHLEQRGERTRAAGPGGPEHADGGPDEAEDETAPQTA
jgi:hypothetical protein